MKIKEIGQEMVKQDNRMTQYVMFVVWDRKERIVPDGFGETRRKNNEDSGSGLCRSCLEKYKNEEELEDWCDDCDQDCFYEATNEFEPDLTAGVFFTAKACQEHIDENRHHYGPDVTTYGISCWRNPEMQAVQKHLIEGSGNKVPNHYQ